MARTIVKRRPSRDYVLCVENSDYPAALELRKIYSAVRDPLGERHGLVRVIDESGEAYLYPRRYFVPIELPRSARKYFGARSAIGHH